MKCIDVDLQKKLKFEKNPNDKSAPRRKVYFIIRTKKCSNHPDNLKVNEEEVEEEVEEEEEILVLDEEDGAKREEEEEVLLPIDLKEHFIKYLKGVI